VTTPAERILHVFDGVSDDASVMVGEALELQPAPLLRAVGSALTYSPRLADMVINRALRVPAGTGHRSWSTALATTSPGGQSGSV
jgi:hypothetical protein